MTTSATQYNESAINFAERVSQTRSEQVADISVNSRSREDVFPAFDRTGLGVALEYEQMSEQPVSDELQIQAEAFGAEFEHSGLTIGTVIHGVDLKTNRNADFIAFVRQTLLERKVIFFRDQHLTEDQQVDFSRCFGELDAFPFGKSGSNPFILEIRHGAESPGTENGWHTDVTWMEKPSLGSIAQCIEVPPYGGDTLFSDSHAAYLGLPVAIQDRLQTLHGVNDYRIFLGAGKRQLPDSLVADLKNEIPFGVSHPLLRTHPETGKTALYIHGGFLRHNSLFDVQSGERLPDDESRELVSLLLKQHARPEYICRFKWEPGSIAFWDNRAAQHYAASDYYPHKRLLRRVTVSGDRPFYKTQ